MIYSIIDKTLRKYLSKFLQDSLEMNRYYRITSHCIGFFQMQRILSNYVCHLIGRC